jgi:DNA-binding response OmpR family regulator
MENLKVLVIDDDPMTCNLVETMLQMENYQTVSANHIDSDKGILPILDKVKPNMLILDFHLGSLETLRYATAIRSNETWQHLPILMTSAIDRRQNCLEAGANDFILKPFDWQEMTERINKMRNGFIHQEV